MLTQSSLPALLGSPSFQNWKSTGDLSVHLKEPSCAESVRPIHQSESEIANASFAAQSWVAWLWSASRCPPCLTQSASASAKGRATKQNCALPGPGRSLVTHG